MAHDDVSLRASGHQLHTSYKALAMYVQDGKTVCLDYTLSLADGTPIDSSTESGTWTYVHGATRMPPGLTAGLAGHGVGDHVRLALSPEEAFGPLDAAGFEEIPKTRFPESALYIGYTGEVPGPAGSIITFRIHAIHADTVTIDLNHPLAAEHVVFEVTVIHIQD